MSRKPSHARHRADTSAKPLIAYARSLGVEYVDVGHPFDGLLFLGPVVRAIDWKTPGKAALTEGQGKLIARGFPLAFVSTPSQLDLVVAEMKRAAKA